MFSAAGLDICSQTHVFGFLVYHSLVVGQWVVFLFRKRLLSKQKMEVSDGAPHQLTSDVTKDFHQLLMVCHMFYIFLRHEFQIQFQRKRDIPIKIP